MGADQSIPRTLTREKVYELTKNTRSLMNVLLDYMLKEITVRDFLALSNPNECKKYVIFMANNLYKYFYELQIVPAKDKKGVIVFRPVKDLINPPENVDNERQSLCLTLAYFYTRIFQIYGSLALTLIDDSKIMMDSGLIGMQSDTYKKGLVTPGVRPYTAYGGAPPFNTLGNFNFLRSYLYDEKNYTKGYLTKFLGDGNIKGQIYFNPRPENLDDYDRPTRQDIYETKIQNGIFFIGYIGGKKYGQLEVSSTTETIGGDIVFKFGKFKYSKKDSPNIIITELTSNIIPKKSLIIQKTRQAGYSTYSYKIKDSDKSISEYFNDLLYNVLMYYKNSYEKNAINTYISTTSQPTLSEVGTADELKLARIIQNLTKTKPLGHCLARALQLLKTFPFKGEPGISHICKAKFFEHSVTLPTGVKTVISRSGIPEPGTYLSSSPGLTALSQLFYDTVLIGTPKIVIGEKSGPNGEPSSMQQYITFMKNMAKLFGDDMVGAEKRSNNSFKSSNLSSIKNKRDGELCGNIKGDIIVPSNITASVYDIVNTLYKTQLEHASKCGKIFNMLFNIQQDTQSGRYKIALSNSIIKNGFPEIEKINYLARKVLVDYYTTCELKYLQGMKIVLDSTKKAASNSPIVS